MITIDVHNDLWFFQERQRGTKFFTSVNGFVPHSDVLLIQRKQNYTPVQLFPDGSTSIVPAQERKTTTKNKWWLIWEQINYVIRNTRSFMRFMPFFKALSKSIKLSQKPRVILDKGKRVATTREVLK